MTFRKSILKFLLPSCGKPKKSSSKPNFRVSNASSQRLSLCDVSSTSSCSLVSDLSNSLIGSNVHIFTLKELKKITQDFSKSNFLGEGGFGRVYKGFIDDKLRPGLKAQSVAVKNLDLDGKQGHREWLAEVIFLGQLTHPHLVKLVGYCCEDEHRLLVYEYMPRGNLENQLFQNYTATLPWLTRLEIAVGAAKGLSFLHEEEKPVIYRDFKASNILLDHDFTAKLSDFGLAIDGPEGDETHVTTRIMGTEGYAAPEYIMTGHVTSMSDVYSFGVVLLELISGRRCLERKSLPNREQNLVDWARPYLKDPHKVDRIMDPRLEGQYSPVGACKAAALAHQCVSHHAKSRPTMGSVVKTLEALLSLKDIPVPFVYVVPNDQTDLSVDVSRKQEEKSKSGVEVKDRHRSGNQARWNIYGVWPTRSRAVYSDTALYNTLAVELYSPKPAPKEFKLSCR